MSMHDGFTEYEVDVIRGKDPMTFRDNMDRAFAVPVAPGDPWGYIRRGLLRLYDHDGDPAIADFSAALRLRPDDAEIYRLRGQAFLANVQQKEAIADFTTVIQRVPSHGLAYCLRGMTPANDYDQMMADFRAAILLLTQTLACLDREFRNYPSLLAKWYFYRGTAHRYLGDNSAAIPDLRKAQEYDEKAVGRPSGWLSRLLSRHHRDEDQGEAMTTAGLQPEHRTICHSTLTSCLQLRGRDGDGSDGRRGALDDLNQAIRLDPSNAHAHVLRGDARRERGHRRRALWDYAKALSLDGDDAAAHRGRALVNKELGRTDAAIAQLDQAIAITKSMLPGATFPPRSSAPAEMFYFDLRDLYELRAELHKKKGRKGALLTDMLLCLDAMMHVPLYSTDGPLIHGHGGGSWEWERGPMHDRCREALDLLDEILAAPNTEHWADIVVALEQLMTASADAWPPRQAFADRLEALRKSGPSL